jgi:hypothetical protein
LPRRAQLAGFTVGRVEVESDRPAGEVVDQTPPGNSTATRGSPVTLSVSRGPSTVTVPDVSLQTVADARTTLRAAGFRVSIVRQETDDEALDGLVMSQDPAGSSEADGLVTLTVGEFVPPPDITTLPTPRPPPTPRRRLRESPRAGGVAGGRSSEHEIRWRRPTRSPPRSTSSAEVRTIEIGRRWAPAATAGGLRRRRRPRPPRPGGLGTRDLGTVDVVLPILHGPWGGRHGVGLCELAGVAYVGPGVLASSVCMDMTPQDACAAPRSPSRATSRSGSATRWRTLRLPGLRQPANMWPSVGISKVREERSWRLPWRSRGATTRR